MSNPQFFRRRPATAPQMMRMQQIRRGQVVTRKPRRVVNRVITNRAEKKHDHCSIDENASIDQNGVIVKISAIGQGDDNHDRQGAYARPISLQMRWAMNPGSPNFTLVRMLIFQWRCPDTDGPPEVADVLENTLPNTNNLLFSPYKQDSNNTRVLWDKMSWVAGESGTT